MHGVTIETVEKGIKLDKAALGNVSQMINNTIAIATKMLKNNESYSQKMFSNIIECVQSTKKGARGWKIVELDFELTGKEESE